MEELKQIHKPEKIKEKFLENPYFHFINEIKLNCEYQTIISQIFGGLLITNLKCSNLNCDYNSSKIESFLSLNLLFSDKTIDFQKVHMNDLLDFFFQQERIKERKCEKCCDTMLKTAKIHVSPNILILVIGRFLQNGNIMQKINTPITFETTLDLTKNVEMPNLNFDKDKIIFNKINPNKQKITYDLIGVTDHQGSNLSEGHYISFCWDYLKEKWYKYSDDDFSLQNSVDFCNENRETYILFYKRRF